MGSRKVYTYNMDVMLAERTACAPVHGMPRFYPGIPFSRLRKITPEEIEAAIRPGAWAARALKDAEKIL